MKVKIIKDNKSIPAPLDFELPNFTILTGENGSGKTHLFEAISDETLGQVTINRTLIKNIKYLPFNGLQPRITEQCDSNIIIQQTKQRWQQLSQAIQKMVQSKLVNTPNSVENDQVLRHINPQTDKDVFIRLAKSASVFPFELTEDHIADNISSYDFRGADLFNSQFAIIFKAYQKHDVDNKLNKIYSEEGYEGVQPYLDIDAFREKYGEEPWIFVNNLLEKLKLPYEVNNPMGSKPETMFVFQLVNKNDGTKIKTQDLSTGEKTLMSLALAIYNTSQADAPIDMLVLDEPDASLNPSMSKLLLDVLENDIVKKAGIPVLISTHSPSTIACAPPSSLYKISRDNKVPVQCDLEDSVKILSYGIPNFRVSIEKRRQVFVEHSNDVKYYESLLSILSRYVLEEFETAPHFLPPHNRDGSNCSDVKVITRQMRDMGNLNVYGLIDWDTVNNPEDQIVVLGLGNRYAIENYIFEPHLLGLYLIEKGFVTPAELGLSDCVTYLDVCDLIRTDSSYLQTLVNAVESLIPWNISGNIETFDSILIDGTVLKIRKELQTIQGHELEEKCKVTWHKLNSVRSNNSGDSELKLDVINKIINSFPGLLSKDIIDTFKEFR